MNLSPSYTPPLDGSGDDYSDLLLGVNTPADIVTQILDQPQKISIQEEYPGISEEDRQKLEQIRDIAFKNAKSHGGVLAVQLLAGPSQEHIDILVRLGRVSKRNVFIDTDSRDTICDASVPQVFGRTLRNKEEFTQCIVYPNAPQDSVHIFKSTNSLPIVYTMNHLARVEYAKMLGTQIANHMELKAYVDIHVKGEDFYAAHSLFDHEITEEELSSLSIPLLGFFDTNDLEHGHYGIGAFLAASDFRTEDSTFRALLRVAKGQNAKLATCISDGHGASALYVFRM